MINILFICFWIDLERVLTTTGNTSAVAGCTRVFMASIPEMRTHHKAICIQWKFTTLEHRSFAN